MKILDDTKSEILAEIGRFVESKWENWMIGLQKICTKK